MKYALIFPGQGSQQVGMGKDLYDLFPVARSVFGEADDALGFSLSDIIFNGPEEKLKLTAYTQPAILATCIAILRVLEAEKGVSFNPAFVAGHSLGEYTALVASGSLSLADGVRLVHKRGSFMQEAVPEGVGAMAAILGLDDEKVVEVCKEASSVGVCDPANFNSPGQLVISGEVEAVDRAVELAKASGAKRAIMLNVSAPFHCSLMRPVADRLQVEMDRCQWKDSVFPLVANVSASAVSSVEDIKRGLYAQTYSPVQWTDSVRFMAENGVEGFVELGAGKVLTGLVKKIAKESRTLAVESASDLDKVLEFLS